MSSQVLLSAFSEAGSQAATASFNFCDPNTLQFPSLRNFYSFGDSYSAGIGAHCGWIKDDFDIKGECLKCDGAYPYQIIEVANASACMEVYHIGCTGASMADIIEAGWNNRTSQLDLMKPVAGQGGWGTLSVGGNDAGFASIVANCIMFDRPSCDDDLDFTESYISNPRLVSMFTTTYLKVLEATTHPDFRLIVTSYAQFFNERTEICDSQYIFYGRYLTQEFRARVNKLVADLNLVIRIAVSVVQLQLVFANSRKGIYFEDWDALFHGHRFCEELPKTWGDAWFFTINGPDTVPNGTAIAPSREPPGQTMVNVTSLAQNCDMSSHSNLTAQMLCDWAHKLEEGIEPSWRVSPLVYPWWITKTMHPKSIAHRKLARVIFKKWMNGEYF